MHICDKCKKFNHCYSKSGDTEADITKRAEVELGGCPNCNKHYIMTWKATGNGGAMVTGVKKQ